MAITVCKILQIKHIRTTPYHPRTNGLCESQHKMLTTELRTRLSRPSAPHWDGVLTEVSFAVNVTPRSEMDMLSPFNLVFGRKPRLSADDICFPSKMRPLPPPDSDSRAEYLRDLHKRLDGMRFAAIESSLEAKETMRSKYDELRAGTIKTRGEKTLVVGDIVSLHRPTPLLKKVSFQWTEPNFVVVAVSPSTCSVRNLAKGGTRSGEASSQARVPCTRDRQSQDDEVLPGS